MSGRSEALAERLEKINDEVIATVEACSDEQWRAVATTRAGRSASRRTTSGLPMSQSRTSYR